MNIDKYVGKVITGVKADEEGVTLFFDGLTLYVWDDGQCCCEHRFTTTDDDPQSLVGGALQRIEFKDGPEEADDYGVFHETGFVEIGTDKGFITLTTHNQHNGYYGGFDLSVREVT